MNAADSSALTAQAHHRRLASPPFDHKVVTRCRRRGAQADRWLENIMSSIGKITAGIALAALLGTTSGAAFAQSSMRPSGNAATQDCMAKARAESDPAKRQQAAAKCRQTTTSAKPNAPTGGNMKKDQMGSGMMMKKEPMSGGTMNSMAPRNSMAPKQQQ
jgi:hypothetical protein